MGCWDEFCVVCGGPPSAPDLVTDVFNEDESEDESDPEVKRVRALNFEDFGWLGIYVGINEAEELIPLGKYADYGDFYLPDQATRFGSATNCKFSHEVEPNLYGLFSHEKCYRLLERDLQYTLRFHDVWPMLMQQDLGGHLKDYTDYGGMEAYHEQYFLFKELYLNGKEWMLQDPMTHHENAERILKVWRRIIKSGFKVDKGKQCGKDHESQAESQAANEAATTLDDHQTPSETAKLF